MIQWLGTLEESLLYKGIPSSFGSIDLTLQHIHHAQKFWLAVLAEADITKLDETTQYNAAGKVMDDLLAGSRQILDIVEAYTEEELLKQVSSPVLVQSRYEFVLHVVNHNSYHRGQIVTMSRGGGVRDDIPALDYEVFLWHAYKDSF